MNLLGIAIKTAPVQREVNRKGYFLSVNINQSVHGVSASFYIRKAGTTGMDGLKMWDTNFRSGLDETLEEIKAYVNEQTK